jgi:hypothetical protein
MLPAIAPPVAPPAEAAKRYDPDPPAGEAAFLAVLAGLDGMAAPQLPPASDPRADSQTAAETVADIPTETATGAAPLPALPISSIAVRTPTPTAPTDLQPRPMGRHPVIASDPAIPASPVDMPPPAPLTDANTPVLDALSPPVTPNPDAQPPASKPLEPPPPDLPVAHPPTEGQDAPSPLTPQRAAPSPGQPMPFPLAMPAPQDGNPQHAAASDAMDLASPPTGDTTPAPTDPRAPVPTFGTRPDVRPADRSDPPPSPPSAEDAPVAPPPPPALALPSIPSSPAATPTLSTQVAQDLHAIAARAEDGTVTVQLQPEELGRLHFHITRTAEGLHIHLAVDQPATLDLLRRHGDALLGDLRLDGFAGTTLSFAGNAPGDDRPAPPPDPPPEAEPAPRIAGFPPLPPGARTSGTLDLRL